MEKQPHIDYRSSKVDTSITDLRRSTHRSSVFEGQHIHLRRSTHRFSKVNTSISEGRHIVTSIFGSRHIYHRSSKSRRIDLRRSKAETSHPQFVVEYCPQLRSDISSWSRPRINDRLSTSRRSYTCSYICACLKINNI